MWLERAREILALKEAGDVAILAGAAVTAFGLSFALPSARGTTPEVAEQGAVVISLAQRLPVPMPKPAVSRHPLEPAPGPSGDSTSLTRQLQSELKRVGCYDGDVHGVWSKSTRAAMKAFTDRVNARLPVDKPDHVLLALLQGHQGRACAVACNEGQAAHAVARCAPEATLAKAAHKPDAAELLPPKVADAPAIIPPPPVAALRPPRPASPPGEVRAAPSPRLWRDEPPATRSLPDATRPPDRAEPAPSADREKHAERDRGPVPAAGVRNGRGRSTTRSASYRQVRYARAIYRNLKRATFGALPFP